MEQDEDSNNASLLKLLNESDERPRSAVNSVVLDYYKKFGRKRDLEQYFSLSTAQSDIRDPRSLFWRRMKEQSDTSDSGEKKSESSNEICRISIKCTIPERSEAARADSPSNNDSESPPIITDSVPGPSPSGEESMDDNHSQKSADGNLDTSINKPLSPTSSVTSQRKLEWDSLADVGYGNESDRKTSASSLSTLEREVLAQKQQYTLDYKQSSDIGLPTAHSTPVDPNDSKPKGKKGLEVKTISISRKDVDFVEVSVPHGIENAQPINVNLTKQFSVNLQKDGNMTVDNIKKDITITPDKNDNSDVNTPVNIDKEIQTTLLRVKEKDQSPIYRSEGASTSTQKAPILICLTNLRRMQRRKKNRKSRTKLRIKKKSITKKEIQDKDKSGEQVSEAESFEYMPGHIYNQNQLKRDRNRPSNNYIAGNKSSLESSAVHTTDSSKESKYSFSKDLDKTLNVLKSALNEKYDSNLKKKLVTDIVHRLLKSNYGEGESTPDFLHVVSVASKKTPTTSTSEADNSEEKRAHSKPKKSILRVNKFDSNNVASTSQSAPNLPSVVNSDIPVMSHLSKIASSTTTETDLSNNSAKDITSSDTVFAKTSSEELYKKYIDALKKEEAYKKHLRDKALFLRQKLVRSEAALNVPIQLDVRTNAKLKELIKDLTRNNYDDGSGDASKLEGGSSSNFEIITQRVPRKHRNHSVFTLSSGNSDIQNRSCNLKKKLQKEVVNSSKAGPSNWNSNMSKSCDRPAVTDSSVQVNINLHDKQFPSDQHRFAEEAKYVCLCTEKTLACHRSPDEVVAYQFPDPMIGSKSNCNKIHPACGIHSPSSSLEDGNNPYTSRKHPKKQKTIIECTRCLQTKINIHPKISDPSVSDLNIINSAECVKLINELYRKVSQTSSECQCSNEKDDSNSNTCKSSKEYIRRCNRFERDNFIAKENEMAPLADQQTVEKNVIQSDDGGQKIFTNQPDNISDNIVIPIKGTHMMLKVSIGGKSMKVEDEQPPKEIINQNKRDREMITDKIKTNIKGTSVLDECSKSVQAENQADFRKTETVVAPVGLKICKQKDVSPRMTIPCGDIDEKGESMVVKNKHVFTSDAVHALATNTYPKSFKISDKKLFLRSNTDTGNLVTSSAIQTDAIYNKDKETQPCSSVEIDRDLATGKLSRSKGECKKLSQAIQKTPSEPSVSESLKSISEDRFQTLNTLKNQDVGDRRTTKEKKCYNTVTDDGKPTDLILDVIKDITKRYSKKVTDKRNKKKCFKEIMSALSFLLDTDDSGDGEKQEFTKRSQTSKGVQCSSGSSSQSETIGNSILNETQINKSAVCQKNNVPMFTAHQIDRFANVLSQKNKGDTSDHESEQNKPNSEQASLKLTCDKGCGCDGSSECKDCIGSSTARSQIQNISKYHEFETDDSDKKTCRIEKKERSLKTSCDMDCGCDGSSECKNCLVDSLKHGTGTCVKEPKKYKNQKESCNSSKKAKTTCDKGCDCDGSPECKECVEPHSSKHGSGSRSQESARPRNVESRCNSPTKTKTTCDKGCDCERSSECKECVEPQPPKYITGTYGKESARLKEVESRCNSPKKIKTTCDKGCGCDGSNECSDCVEPHSSKYKNGSCGKDSTKSRKQEARYNSPKKTKFTCDKGCGCDGSSECVECVRPHSPKYETGKCGQTSKLSKKQERYNSPTITKTTCDKACSCDGNSECKECNHKSGRCGKETVKCKKQENGNSPKKFVNRCVQSTVKKVRSLYSHYDDSSDLPISTDPPCCSSDSPTAKLVNKIKRECDKYQKRCKISCKKCDASSSTAVSCDHCRRARQYHFRCHRCRCHRTRSTENAKKKCLAYNLIVQTSDSIISEETVFDKCRPLQNVIVRVPKCKQGNIPFKEAYAKIEQKLPHCSTSFEPKGRSQSWPNECGISSTDDVKMAKACTVRQYLERNRPDFVDSCATRQSCLRMISDTRAKERTKLREQLVGLESLPSLNNEELIYLAKELGLGRRRPLQQKIISEREMKKHSEKIYKSLPEVKQKKEEAKKERIKKTNLLMANIFKKNLQKKTLNGKVNISNYSQVVKI